MKKLIINCCMKYIKNNTNYDEIKLKEIEYGLVSIYLTITKTIIISIIAIILGIFKEMWLFMLFFILIRVPAFGLHANKSWTCLLVSTFFFIVCPFLCLLIKFNIIAKVIIGIISIVLIFKNAPADTHKRPLVSKKRRLFFKTLSTLIAIVFSFVSLLIDNQFISNCLLIALMLENILISPFTYKLFKLPYNNYITYLKEHPDFAQ